MGDDAKALIVAAGARLPPGPQPEILPRAAFEAMVPAGAVHPGMALALQAPPGLPTLDFLAPGGPPPPPAARTPIPLAPVRETAPHTIAAPLPSAAPPGAL